MGYVSDRRKLRSQTADKIWTDEKQRWEESEKRVREEKRRRKRKSQKKEDADALKGKSRNTVFFQ